MGEDLERLVRLERFGEMLGVLTEKQLVVVALRLEGLNGEEIGELLGITRKGVQSRLAGARQRLLDAGLVDELEVADRDGRLGIKRSGYVRARRGPAAVSCGSVGGSCGG